MTCRGTSSHTSANVDMWAPHCTIAVLQLGTHTREPDESGVRQVIEVTTHDVHAGRSREGDHQLQVPERIKVESSHGLDSLDERVLVGCGSRAL